MRYPLPWFPLSDDPSRYSCRTTANCRPYRSFRLGCRFGRSGSSGFVGGFRRLRWFNRGFVLKVHGCRNRCRYRYICRPGGLLARGWCRLERIRLLLRDRLKSRNCVHAERNLHTQDGLLRLVYNV